MRLTVKVCKRSLTRSNPYLSSERPPLSRCFSAKVWSRLMGGLRAGVLRQCGQEHRRVGAAGGRDAGARGAERALRLGARAGGGGSLAVQARACA